MTDTPAPPPGDGRRLSLLARFVLIALGALVVLTLAWVKVSPWLSYPVGMMARTALEQAAPMWVRATHQQTGQVAMDTTVAITVPNAGGRKAELTLEADPARYAYGLPILWALLAAAWATGRAPGRTGRALLGYALLLPTQAFSLALSLLMQLVLAAQLDTALLRIDAWQLNAIIFGYQVGALVLPTLAPVLVWLLLDQRFFAEVIVPGWNGQLGKG